VKARAGVAKEAINKSNTTTLISRFEESLAFIVSAFHE
jgi:hypothetical protein